MSGTLLSTTSPEGLQPLGSAAQRSFELLTGTLRDRLGPDHAALFAEPVSSEHGDRIDWYSTSGGTPAGRMTEQSVEAQSELRETLAEYVADIRNLAAELRASGAAGDARLAEAMTLALEVPSESMIWALKTDDGRLRPVLVHWAWVGGEQSAVRGVLTRMVPRNPASQTPVAARHDTGEGSAGWWWAVLFGWLLLALMLAVVLWLLIAPCGLRWADGWRPVIVFCPAEQQVGPDPFAAERQLQDRIAALRHELALLDSACRPTVPVLPAVPGETPPDPGGAPPEVPEEGAAPDTPDRPAPEPDAAPVPGEQDGAERAMQRVKERGGESGALNFVLDWSTPDDLDLYVTCPTGETVSFQKRDACGGRYDLDANLTSIDTLPDPVENVVFDTPEPGIYKLRANLRGARSDGAVPLRLHVLRDGHEPQTFTGTLAPGQGDWTMNINISR